MFDEKEYAMKIIENEGDFHKIAASSDTDEKIKMIFYLVSYKLNYFAIINFADKKLFNNYLVFNIY